MNENNEFKEVDFDELNFSDLNDNVPNDWTWEKNYDFRDPVVSRVVKQFVDRSNTGYNKYGQTLDSERREGVKNLGEYLQDVQEELMDAILYIQAAKEDLACTPQCKCQVKDVEPRAKTTIGDLSALHDLKAKMLVKKFNDKQHAANKEAQAIWDKDNFGHINSFYGNDYASNNT